MTRAANAEPPTSGDEVGDEVTIARDDDDGADPSEDADNFVDPPPTPRTLPPDPTDTGGPETPVGHGAPGTPQGDTGGAPYDPAAPPHVTSEVATESGDGAAPARNTETPEAAGPALLPDSETR